MEAETIRERKGFRKSLEPTLKELKFTLKRVKQSPLSIAGLVIVIFFVVIAVLSPYIAPSPAGWRDRYMIPRDGFTPTPRPPSPQHPFGTTQGQYDIYYGCIWGTRTAFRVGLTVVTGILIVGVILGSISGYYGGVIDEIIMRTTDIFYAIPGLVLAMALVVAFGPSIDSVIRALVIVGWPTYARMIRAETMRIRNEDFIEAAKAIGASDFRIIARHILPNAIYPVLIMASMDTGSMVLTAAALSFLGLGAPVGYADWGQMIAMSRNWIIGMPGHPYIYWYTFIIPGVFIFVFVLGWNLLGDAFRDILDPMIRRR